MHSLRRARALAVALAESASSPYNSGRLYSAGATKWLSPATAYGRTRAASKRSTAAEAEAESSLASPTDTPYRITKFVSEPPRDAETVSWPRPSEIPFQTKVANAVSLIGHVHMPVQFQSAPDGKFWAQTVITRDQPSESPSLWIPVIFEGDLAHIAACHLKQNDHICIEGQLTAGSPAFGENPGQANVQVMVNSLNFVEGSSRMKVTAKYEKPATTKKTPAATKKDAIKKIEDSWRDLVNNPEEWSDYRKAKLDKSVSEKFPDFKRRDQSAALWLNTAPRWALPNIEGIQFGGNEKSEPARDKSEPARDKSNPAKENKDAIKKIEDSWRDLVNNPEEWSDYRKAKLDKSVSEKFPDFKRGDQSAALWLNTAPRWALPNIEGIQFGGNEKSEPARDKSEPARDRSNPAKENKGDEAWKDLVENPGKWWDNRSNKKNIKAPDFKHKETGQALWLNSSPSWVLAKLPPLIPQEEPSSSWTNAALRRSVKS